MTVVKCRECGEPRHNDEPWLHAECADEQEANASSDETQLRVALEDAQGEAERLRAIGNEMLRILCGRGSECEHSQHARWWTAMEGASS